MFSFSVFSKSLFNSCFSAVPAFFLINLILFPVRRNNFQCFSVGFTRYRYRMTIVASIVKPRRPHTLFDIAGRIFSIDPGMKNTHIFHNKHEPPPSTRPSLTFINSKIFIFTCDLTTISVTWQPPKFRKYSFSSTSPKLPWISGRSFFLPASQKRYGRPYPPGLPSRCFQ